MGRTCPFFRIVDQIVGETTCAGNVAFEDIVALPNQINPDRDVYC